MHRSLKACSTLVMAAPAWLATVDVQASANRIEERPAQGRAAAAGGRDAKAPPPRAVTVTPKSPGVGTTGKTVNADGPRTINLPANANAKAQAFRPPRLTAQDRLTSKILEDESATSSRVTQNLK